MNDKDRLFIMSVAFWLGDLMHLIAKDYIWWIVYLIIAFVFYIWSNK